MPKFREITGQFVGYIPDSIDADIVPDRAPMNGRVTFTPVFTGGVIAFPELSPPEFAHPRTIHAKIVDGFVQVEVNEGEGDDEHIVLQPLSLMVTVDDEASQVWSWRAEFSEILIGASDEYVQIPSWSFRVPDGTGPVDLTELVPLKSTGTVDVTKGPRGAGLENITAVDGQLVFEYTDGQESTVPIPEAVQGPEGPQGPAGADGEQGPQGEKGDPGEIPDLLVGNITDATPTGKNLMLAATEGAARNALGLEAGATATNGALSELENGVSNSPRVWTPANLANYTAAQAASAKGYAVFRVTDYGATGNGTTDDSAAIQAAVDAASANGGGDVVFSSNPAGGNTFLTSTPVILRDDITIRGEGWPTIIRKNATGPYAVFISGSQTGQGGYGAGASNVTMRGLMFRGDYANGVDACAMGLHHSENILVDDCKFVEFSSEGHVFDLAGCRNVTIRDCVFSGSNRGTGSHECIQIDISAYSSTSAHIAGDFYDLTPTRGVRVTGCTFEPLKIGATWYPCPQPIGSHAEYDQVWFEDITFDGNTVIDPPVEGDWLPGVVHFSCIRDASVSNNTFRTTGNLPTPDTPVISFVTAPRAFSAEADPNLPSSGYIDITPMKPSLINVSGNRVEGFGSTRTSRAALWFSGCDILTVSNNHIRGARSGPNGAIGLVNSTASQVLNNTLTGSGDYGIYGGGTTSGRIVGNACYGYTRATAAASSAVRFEEIQVGESSVEVVTGGTAAYVTVNFPREFSIKPSISVVRSTAVPNGEITFSVNSVTTTSARVYCVSPNAGTYYFVWSAVTA